MCVLLIKRLLRLVGRWAGKPVNHTSWVALVTPTDRPKSVRNRCLIELFCGVVCVVTLPFWHFCWCRGFCHRTESDLFLFLLFIHVFLSNKTLHIFHTFRPAVFLSGTFSADEGFWPNRTEEKFRWGRPLAETYGRIVTLRKAAGQNVRKICSIFIVFI